MSGEFVDNRRDLSTPEAPKILGLEQDSDSEKSPLEKDYKRFLQKRERVEKDLYAIKVQKAKLDVGIKNLEESLDWVVNGMSGGEDKLPVDDTSVKKLQAELAHLQAARSDLLSSETYVLENYEALNYRVSAIEELGVDLFSKDTFEGKTPEETHKLDIAQGKYLAYKECDAKFAEYFRRKNENGDYSDYTIDEMMLLYTMTRPEEIQRFLSELDEIFPGQVKKENFSLPHRDQLGKDVDIDKFDRQIEESVQLRNEIVADIRKSSPKYQDFGGGVGLSYSIAKKGDFTVEQLGARGVSKSKGKKVTQDTISAAMGNHLRNWRGDPFEENGSGSYKRITQRAENIDFFVD